jgi:hypothetical protein
VEFADSINSLRILSLQVREPGLAREVPSAWTEFLAEVSA